MSETQHLPAAEAARDPQLARYSRQVMYERIGADGQRKLLGSRAVLFGCGALGSVSANTLVRAGVGFLRICDRDFIERDNLQRQVLFDEDDIAANLPKAQAAANKLRRINSEITVEPVVADVNPGNIEELSRGMDVLLDGTDNFETRFLINDLAVKSNRPWVYGAVIGATGLCMAIVPNDTPCLRCVFEEAPPPEMNPTCDTAGVVGPAVNLVASLQAMEAIKLLMGRRDQINRHLVHLDAWSGRLVNMKVQSAYDDGKCPCCRGREFSFLDGHFSGTTTSLCGRDAVQVVPSGKRRMDFNVIAAKLGPVALEPVRFNEYMLRAKIDRFELTLFPDGRVIVKGTADVDRARSIHAKYLGA